MTILEEARHSLIVIEHDPMLYEDAQGMVECVSQGLHDAAKEAAVLLYSPGNDTFLQGRRWGWWHWWWHRIVTRTKIDCYSKSIIQPLRSSQMLFSLLIISRTIGTNALVRLLSIDCWLSIVFLII